MAQAIARAAPPLGILIEDMTLNERLNIGEAVSCEHSVSFAYFELVSLPSNPSHSGYSQIAAGG